MPMPAPKPAGKGWLRSPSGKRGRRALLGVGGVAVVAALVGAGVMVFGGDKYADGTDTAGEAVVAYLEALQRGDVKAALSLGRERPPDTSLLTREILMKQMEKFPITDVKVLGDIPTTDGGELVRVLAKIGGVGYEGRVKLDQPPHGQGWKLNSAAMTVELKLGHFKPELLRNITVWGKPIPKSGKAYVFPSLVELGSSNPYLEVEDLRADDEDAPSLFEISAMKKLVIPDLDVSDEGEQKLKEAALQALDECAKSTSLEPPNCPNSAQPDDPASVVVPDSVKWTSQTDSKDISVGPLDTKTGKVSVSGIPHFEVSAQIEGGGTETGTVSAYFDGNADLTTDPPTINLDGPR